MKLLPPADFQLFEAHRLDKHAYLCRLLGGSRAARPVLELLRKPGAVMRKADCKCTFGLRMLAFRDDVRSIQKYRSVCIPRLARSRKENSWLQ